MTQSTILAVGTTAATSSDVTVTDGTAAIVGIFATSGPILAAGDTPVARVIMDTPSSVDNHVEMLTPDYPQTVVNAPSGCGDIVVRVERFPGVSLGAFKNQA